MLGLLTDNANPHLTNDDQLLVSALVELGVSYKIINWNVSLPTQDVSCLLIRSPWDYYLKPQKFLKYLDDCESMGIKVLNSAQIVRWNHTKHYLKELEQIGFDIVDSYFAAPGTDILELQNKLASLGWNDVVIKPAISGSSYLTFKTQVTNPDFYPQAEKILSHGDLLAQPFLPSIRDSGEISLIYFNGTHQEFSHAVLKKPRIGDFRVQNDFGGMSTDYSPTLELKNLCSKILKHLPQDWLYVRLDLVDCEKTPLISEIEMIEPALYFLQHPQAAKKMAKIILEKKLY